MKPLAIVHFQPLELYPPITNFINYVVGQKLDSRVVVFTTRSANQPFSVANRNISILRYGDVSAPRKQAGRILQYLIFYIKTFFGLLKYKPSCVLYYESLSFLPVYFYYKLGFLFGRSKPLIFCHYHEYTSPKQYQNGMILEKINHRLERKVYRKMEWISHTNDDRKKLFFEDNKYTFFKKLTILPNYPPTNWSKNSCHSKHDGLSKIVYVGALGMDTMYIKELASWVESQIGLVTWDIYSQQDPAPLLSFLKSIDSKNIHFRGSVNYYELPNVLKNYDIGVILYKGHIPNYVYNAPNKLFEYSAFDLDVWFPPVMRGCIPYATNGTYPKIIPIDFETISFVTVEQFTNRQGLEYLPHHFTYESVFSSFFDELKIYM